MSSLTALISQYQDWELALATANEEATARHRVVVARAIDARLNPAAQRPAQRPRNGTHELHKAPNVYQVCKRDLRSDYWNQLRSIEKDVILQDCERRISAAENELSRLFEIILETDVQSVLDAALKVKFLAGHLLSCQHIDPDTVCMELHYIGDQLHLIASDC